MLVVILSIGKKESQSGGSSQLSRETENDQASIRFYRLAAV
jgi:hypothetical protein